MACRLPGARTPAEFWKNLANGMESVVSFTEAELREAGVDPSVIAQPEYVRAGVVLEGMEMFDAGFFGLSPKEAAIMDPQHRHFLECSWEAIEASGHVPEKFAGSIGVFAGCGMNAYMMFNLLTNRQLMDSTGLFLVRHTGNDKDFLSTRVSYQFNLRGPSMSVQTACSTSLVAIHLASQSLLSGECDMALAGGVTIELPHRQGYMYQEGEILSRDGHCRAFDADSTGTIFGSGVGVVVLRRLEDALADRDSIYAVIRGSAINNDGSSKVGYLAPSVDGQARAISEALAVAGVPADSIGYVETHGTGTAVGDPIEMAALTNAFAETTKRRNYCAVGSVKPNIGHLDTAAGVASFIKVVEALQHRQIPPSLHFAKPNPLIDFENSPFFVNDKLRDWTPGPGTPRRAGVSSLGVGGTNAHVVVEEAPVHTGVPAKRDWQLFPMSARSVSSLDGLAPSMGTHLAACGPADFADAAFTAQTGRKRFKQRRILVARDGADAARALETRDPSRIASKNNEFTTEPSVAFLFPGGGAQYPNMARGLYETEKAFASRADECFDLLRPQLDFDLKSLMFPAGTDLEEAARSLQRPLQSILSIFVVEYATAHLWMSWGVLPTVMTGHSLGEYSAACLSGVLSLRDALLLVVSRGRLFERMPEGGMLGVSLPEADVVSLLGDKLSVAAVNGPSSCVVSGDVAGLEALEKVLSARDVDCSRLRINVAAHSPMLEPFLAEFAAVAAGITLGTAKIPYVSNLTGGWIRPEDLDKTYWVRHLRQTVRFSQGLGELLKKPDQILLEVGPGTTLSSLVQIHPSVQESHTVVSSVRHPKDNAPDQMFILMALGRLWMAGLTMDWSKFWTGDERRRVRIPTYHFDHKRHWIEAGKLEFSSSSGDRETPQTSSAIAKLQNMDEWFWSPTWKPLAAAEPPSAAGTESWLIFCDRDGLGKSLASRLRDQGHRVTLVTEGASFGAEAEDRYVLKAGDRSQCDSLVASLVENGRTPRRIVYLWSYGGDSPGTPDREIDVQVWTPVSIIQALAAHDLLDRVSLTFVSSEGHRVLDTDRPNRPDRAMLAGPAKVIAQEFPGVASRWIDLVRPDRDTAVNTLVEVLISEASQEEGESRPIAHRNSKRYVEDWDRVAIPAGKQTPLRQGGVYAFTGGLGDMALSLAGHLARRYKAGIVLLHRSAFPARDQWEESLKAQPHTRTARQIRALLAIEAAGGGLFLRRVDIANADQTRTALLEIKRTAGAIHGIFHTAGVMRDGIIQDKSRSMIAEVVASKFQGTLSLDAVLGDLNPDFLLLCSSTSALLGLAGQVDYVAANAFLDAYARKAKGGNTKVMSVNWGIWNELGMAARALSGSAMALSPDRAGAALHPLLGGTFRPGDGEDPIYASHYHPGTHWVLSEHKLRQGSFVLPGSAYAELAIAAGRGCETTGGTVVRNLTFIAPMIMESRDGARELQVRTRNGASTLTIASTAADADGRAPVDHAQAEISHDRGLRAGNKDLAEIRRQCCHKEIDPRVGEPLTRQEEHLDFGPRWKNIHRVWVGKNQLLGEFLLAPAYETDLAIHPAHPALLDMATGAGLALLPGILTCADLFVPLSYGSIVAYAPLEKHIFSHVRLHPGEGQSLEVAVFDISICDPSGRVLLDIERFTMRRIPGDSFKAGTGASQKAGQSAAPAGGNSLSAWIAAGIRPEEGAEAVERLLAAGMPQTVASSIDLGRLIDVTRPKPSKALLDGSRAGSKAGGDEIENFLLDLWSDLLGIPNVGLDDDFFALGGHSLIAVRLFAKIRKTYHTDLGLATLFEARTIRQFAALLRKELGPSGGETKKAWSCLVPLRKTGTKPILFCLHGVGGNVLGYRELVEKLPQDQPFYAIQALNLSRRDDPVVCMKTMAVEYVREILTAQPQGPYYICGYSFGGLAAFEVAQQLVAQGNRIAFLGMFDTDRPGVQMDLATRVQLNLRHLWKLDPAEKVKYAKRKLLHVADRFLPKAPSVETKPLNTAPEPRVLDVREANFQAYRGYRAQVYPGKVTLFRAVEHGDSGWRKPNLGWTGMAADGLDIRDIPGNHMTILYEPNVSVLARRLAECLDEIYSREAGSGSPPVPAYSEGTATVTG